MINYRNARFTPSALIHSLMFGDVGFGDAYMRGKISVEGSLADWIEANSGSRKLPYLPLTTRKVEAHYDIPAAFYELLLGPSMSYTCANFESGTTDLIAAQINKIVQHLSWLSGEQGKPLKLMDCGCGWGSFMNSATINPDFKEIHGLTLSLKQADYIGNNYPHLDSVFVGSWMDYWALDYYDRFTAIGMLEHVGKDNLAAYFGWVHGLLNEEGVGTLQFCSRDKPISRWTDKHIFPGAYPPNANEVLRLMPRKGLRVTDLRECHQDYVFTLEYWLENLESSIDGIKALGFDDDFIRMFRLYLNGGIASFRSGATQLIQLRFEKI